MHTRTFQMPATIEVCPFSGRYVRDGLEPMDKFDEIRQPAVADIGTIYFVVVVCGLQERATDVSISKYDNTVRDSILAISHFRATFITPKDSTTNDQFIASQAATAVSPRASLKTGSFFCRIALTSAEVSVSLALSLSTRHSATNSVNICVPV